MKTLLLSLILIASTAFGQTYQAPSENGAVIVATCGTAPTGYPATSGTRAPNTVDVNGNACTSGGGGGGSNAAAGPTGAAVPADAGYTGGNLAGVLVGIAAYTDAGSSGLGVHVANSPSITNISGTVSLPTGASTSALQTTGNTSLSDIDTSTTALGAKTDAKNSATDTTSVSIVAILKELSSLAQILGQTTMSASTPVAVASDQSAIPVKGSAATGAAAGAPVTVGALSPGTVDAIAFVADPCQTSQGFTVSGSISTSTTVIAGTGGKITTICGEPYIYVNGTATSWAMVEGTGTLCATNLAANFGGGTTAAAGPNFLANQGQMLGGNYVAYVGTRAGDGICLLLSAGNQVNYTIRYVVQ
jgi:hypothetical protein